MSRRRFPFAGALLAFALMLPSCGGGGGPSVLTLIGVQVLSQPPGPLSPFGTTAGGDEIRLIGSLFPGVATVLFGLVPATNVRVQSASEILVTSPPGAPGKVDVTVLDGGTGERTTIPLAFEFIRPPTLLSVAALTGPTSGEAEGPVAGGETIEVKGSNFKAGCQVLVDGIGAVTVFVDANTARFTLPAAAGDRSVDLSVRNAEGLIATLVKGFFYTQEFCLDPVSDALTDELASHLYRRAGLGASPANVAAARADGLGLTVTRLLDFANDASIEATALDLYGATPPPNADVQPRTNQEYWIHLMLRNPNPLQERMAYFLHTHFATSQRGFPENATWWMYEQVRTFRRFAMRASEGGYDYDWRRICIEVCKDRAMLEWLNGLLSRNESPNENFARELWELFMLGEGVGYTQADIVQAARAFTGFNVLRRAGLNYGEVVYDKERHDALDKTILGRTGKYGYDSVSPFHEDGAGLATDARDTGGGVVALTLAERPVEASRFICRKLARFLLYDDPDDVVVDQMAADLRAANWNMKPVLDRVLRSKAFFSFAARKRQIKSPIEYSLQALRSTNILLRESLVRVTTEAMGQTILDPPDVNGWLGGAGWLGAQASLQRIDFMRIVALNLNDVPTQVDPLLPPVGQRTPTEIVDHLANVLDVGLPPEARTAYIAYVTQQLVGDSVVPFPFDPLNPEHRRMKTRGLIYMIGQHHDGQRQ